MARQHLERRLELPCSVQELWDWHMRPEAFLDLVPPWQSIEILETDGPIAEGSKVLFAVKLGPFKQKWEAVHANVDPPNGFRDTQLRGPFAHWQHDHLFEETATGSVLIDRIEYAVPLGWLGQAVAGWYIRRDLKRLFDHRHAVTAEALGAKR